MHISSYVQTRFQLYPPHSCCKCYAPAIPRRDDDLIHSVVVDGGGDGHSVVGVARLLGLRGASAILSDVATHRVHRAAARLGRRTCVAATVVHTCSRAVAAPLC